MALARPVRWLAAVAVLAPTALAVGLHAHRSRLESYFVTLSDYRILDVRPSPSGAAIRVIHLHLIEDTCWTRVMRAYEVTLPDTTAEALAGTPLCTLTQRRVERAIERSHPEFVRATDGIPYGTYFDSIVSVCDGRPRRLVFDYNPWGLDATPGIDPVKLRDYDPAVYAAFRMGQRIAATAALSAPAIDVQEEQGTAAAAELVAGRYDIAYRDMCWNERNSRTRCTPAFWRQLLGHYTGPPEQRGPLPPELLERDSFKFARYIEPEFPRIALSARIFGDVKMRLTVERETGAVVNVALLDGRPLLNTAAITAAWQWLFVAGTTPPEPFDVTVHFEEKCPGVSSANSRP